MTFPAALPIPPEVLKIATKLEVVEFGVSLMDDLARRDFTINAIAYHPIRHDWRDPFQGEQDLAKKLIRSVGDPNWRFQEDYLRILRGLRFSARFDFRIHSRTLEAAKANAQGLAQLSAERVRDEWFKGLLSAARPSELGALRATVAAIMQRQEPLQLKDLAIKGDELIKAGVRPGPDVGETLQRLLDEVLEDPARNTREYLLSRV